MGVPVVEAVGHSQEGRLELVKHKVYLLHQEFAN
jgi:hypothetical protein